MMLLTFWGASLQYSAILNSLESKASVQTQSDWYVYVSSHPQNLLLLNLKYAVLISDWLGSHLDYSQHSFVFNY